MTSRPPERRQHPRAYWKRGTLVGKTVICRGRKRVVIRQYHADGGVVLDREVEGFRSWNVEDLRWPKR